ncbi:MAG: SPASM domain-containing protein [Flavobacteriales bacterium]|nr:SPASM domain-containing protein [Flavobacteriales bacterium]
MKGDILDARSFGRVVTYQRLHNIWLNHASFRNFKRTGNTYHPGLPVSISIEPTTSCNLRCPHCPSGLRSFSRPTGMLNPEMNKRIIDQLGTTLSYITYYFQGEPLLHPGFSEMVHYASSKKIYTASSTNAHHLNRSTCDTLIDSGLSKLIISIDGSTQESYSTYRIGGNLNKVIDGTRNLLEARRVKKAANPVIVWQFIVFRHNEHEIGQIRQMAKELGVDSVQIKTAQLYDPDENLEMLPSDKKWSRYTVDNGKVKFEPSHLNSCRRMWSGCVITWDGEVVPCCFDKDAKYGMGNIQSSDFESIWNGDKYRDFRDTLFRGRQNIDICMNCSEGVKVFD